MGNTEVKHHRTKLLPEMEGTVARMYARNRGTESQLAGYRKLAAELTAALPDGARVLEVAPGPGYFAVEMARLGRFTVTGLDVSKTFVELAADYARQEGVDVEFRQGDVAALPFEAGSFDFLVCQAAFKNFARPVVALDELHRVLRPGGVAVIHDMNHDATAAEIAHEVDGMRLGRVAAFTTRQTLHGLRRRAYTPAQFTATVAESAFKTCVITTEGIGLEIRLTKQP
jgi:ubiquinone/menaquinone biosynthesis C-methylase UbiE